MPGRHFFTLAKCRRAAPGHLISVKTTGGAHREESGGVSAAGKQPGPQIRESLVQRLPQVAAEVERLYRCRIRFCRITKIKDMLTWDGTARR